jgi:hypothetical protein
MIGNLINLKETSTGDMLCQKLTADRRGVSHQNVASIEHHDVTKVIRQPVNSYDWVSHTLSMLRRNFWLRYHA